MKIRNPRHNKTAERAGDIQMRNQYIERGIYKMCSDGSVEFVAFNTPGGRPQREEKLNEEYRDEQERIKERRLQLEGEKRMNQWIVEVSRSDEGFAGLAGYAEGGIQTMCLELSDEFYSAERTRERDKQIASCYDDEIRPFDDDGENWKENLERKIEDRIREELVKLAFLG